MSKAFGTTENFLGNQKCSRNKLLQKVCRRLISTKINSFIRN